jgi:hypothetical protein
MEPNGLNPASATALVVRTIRDIEQSTDEQRDALLSHRVKEPPV